MTEILVFRGIVVTADNYRHVSGHAGRYADITLQAQHRFGVGGYARAAGYLLAVAEEVRADVEADGIILGNVTGMRYADGVQAAVDRWNAGDHSLRYVAANRDMLAREAAARKRSGVFVPERMESAFAGLL